MSWNPDDENLRAAQVESKVGSRAVPMLPKPSTWTIGASSSSMIGTGKRYFFNHIKEHARNPTCSSLDLEEQLRRVAVKKDSDEHNRGDKNLLYPPGAIKIFLTKSNVKSALGCNCGFCKEPPGGRNVLSDQPLVDILTRKAGPDADETSRKFCVLILMGAGFTARHVCSIYNRGLDISDIDTAQQLQDDLFVPLYQRGLFNDLANPESLTTRFIDIFKEAQQVFNTPKFDIGEYKSIMKNANLPFLGEASIFGNANRHGRAQVYQFVIHLEYRGALPQSLVRKETIWNKDDTRERDALLLCAQSNQSHLIKLLCWYQYENSVNYIFKRYSGTLEDILNNPPVAITPPARYHGSQLQHWLWQGCVDVISALAFFHAPVTPDAKQGQISAAHCDLKPANILVNDDEEGLGDLIVADFGHAQLFKNGDQEQRLEKVLGDSNYQPPPRIVTRGSRPDMTDPAWLQACDVWSMACVLVEVIEYIRSNDGPRRVKEFRQSRENENTGLNHAFWIATPGSYRIRRSVLSTLQSFRSPQDPYLNSVTDLLQDMLSIDPSRRPTMAMCHDIISQNVPTDEWPLLDSGETSISGLGASTLLRNMPTQFERKMDSGQWDRRRCKMYLLLNTAARYERIRLALEFFQKPERLEGKKPAVSEVTYVLSDTARLTEEVYKPLSLFDRYYVPAKNPESLCSFEIIHPKLKFVFEEPWDYFHFLTATTRQEICIFQEGKRYEYAEMRTTKCRIRPEGISFRDKTQTYLDGHVQVWKELSDAEYVKEFMPSSTSMSPGDRRGSINSNVPSSMPATSYSTGSSSSGLSSPRLATTLPPSKRAKVRLVLLLTGQPPRFLTINLTSGLNDLQWQLDANKTKSSRHLTIRSIHKGMFRMGNFSSSDNGCPGVPLEPRVFEEAERFEANWVEIEFQTSKGLADCHGLCEQTLRKITT